MIHQVKSLALAALLVVGTVATGAVVVASQLAGRPGDGGEGHQTASAAANQADPREPRAAATNLQPASKAAQKTISPVLVQQLRAAGQAFDDLLSSLHDPSLDDIDRLSNWSNLTREADAVLAIDESELKAVSEAHRDRMRKLTKRFEYLPASENNQQTKLARAMSKLAAAEERELEAGTHATDAKAGPLGRDGKSSGE